ncbi:DNA-binding transcriptional regulator, LysR family [Nonomuraea solani]|uniref:DNA-binding transcriptional regulator, LysR family n=1 Tax=Nonomuraea solani TaxID=1144553 RepID=A0A1H5YBV4_9ACTN|nr:LysR family transcriptional regulator [Nonomuraea solani]SEG21225.1 DNA-binding transcriptional regulator, LysR family [Nonomuraea solani]
MLDRVELESFLVLAEELHFGRTAQRLHVTTGRVSQAIKQLERRVGVPLFERTSRFVRLTAVGSRLYDDLRPACDQIEAGLARAIASGRGIRGVLRVGYSSPWCGDLVVRAADVFRVRHPGCEVHIQEVQLRDPLGPLRAGELDLQLTEFPIDEPDITTGPVIYTEPRALMVASGHPLARHESVSLEDLAETTLVSISGQVPAYWLEYHYPRHTPAGRPIPQGPAVGFWQETLSHVSAGKVVSTAAARAAHYFSHPGVTYVPYRDAPPIEYGLLWPAAAENTRVRAFVHIVCDLATASRA